MLSKNNRALLIGLDLTNTISEHVSEVNESYNPTLLYLTKTSLRTLQVTQLRVAQYRTTEITATLHGAVRNNLEL